MSETPSSMIRAEIVINGGSAFLAQGQDVHDLKRNIEAAASSGGTFVDFIVEGNRSVSALITSTSSVTISITTVLYAAHGTGDDKSPFGGFYNL
ncbi:hypothetical protein [Microbacterium esteraromaticum]|uniref:hypothetical protein n=1 Tax=Microbacterium esteraromaticum TaxID=57043 RepID=UPI00211AA6F4|nr:hypothetical protein [Microbacterium esteraromaticum]